MVPDVEIEVTPATKEENLNSLNNELQNTDAVQEYVSPAKIETYDFLAEGLW